MIGLLGLAIFFSLLAMGMPIAFSLFVVGTGGLLVLTGLTAAFSSVASACFNYTASYTFSVVAMFILMGMLASSCKLLDEVFEVSRRWLGGMRAGEGLATIAANVMFGAATGSSLAAVVVIGRASLPAMKKAGYPEKLAMGTVAAGGTLASMIPPSILMCIFGIITDQSIGKLLLAGFIPGLTGAFLYGLVVLIGARKIKVKVSDLPKDTFWEKVKYTGHLWVVMIIVIVVMGSIYAGICTPTEAGAIGALTVFVLCFALRRLTVTILKTVLKDTIKTTGMILIILAAAAVFSRFLVLSGFTDMLTDSVTKLDVNRYLIFSIVVLIYLFLGCVLTATAMLVVSLPVFFPVMTSLGFDPIWFGIIVVVLCEVALLTPPVGMNAYVAHTLDPSIPLPTVFRGCMPFVVSDLVNILILTIFPSLVLFVPNHMS